MSSCIMKNFLRDLLQRMCCLIDGEFIGVGALSTLFITIIVCIKDLMSLKSGQIAPITLDVLVLTLEYQ